MTENVIERVNINGLLTKMLKTFVGSLRDDESTIELIEYPLTTLQTQGNVRIKHPSVNLGNDDGVYLFGRPVKMKLAKAKYDKFRSIR